MSAEILGNLNDSKRDMILLYVSVPASMFSKKIKKTLILSTFSHHALSPPTRSRTQAPELSGTLGRSKNQRVGSETPV